MKTTIQHRARVAFLNSLKDGRLDASLVARQVTWLSSFTLTERVKLLQSYRSFVENKIKEASVEVFSTVEIDETEKTNLEKLLKGKFGQDKEVVFNIDPNLIGGVRIKQKDNLYDYSIMGKLEQIREVFA
jgi:F-type H+-transporting ATPase subunit delta